MTFRQCSVGIRSPLKYECERCNAVSLIPHPMYRYQESPAAFGNNPWFCQPCADFTNRRILPSDLPWVPVDDCPESWGRRDEWLARVREQRRREQHTLLTPRRDRGWLRPLSPRAWELLLLFAAGAAFIGVAAFLGL